MNDKKLPINNESLISFFNRSSSNKMADLVQYVIKNDLTDSEILFLANGLAKSGNQLIFPDINRTSDIPSTGGPSSLSTLLCPLFLKLLGNTVIKLGVSGRPAGGLDVLAQIKGYNFSPNKEEIYEWVNTSKYVHFLANENYAPLDAELFTYRRANNALNIPSLVIASILSKKIAVGIRNIGLDIRVSKFGNFGRTWSEAYQNGIRFNKVACLAGIKSKSFITNGDCPQQPYIGRGESILALSKIFSGDLEPYLRKHVAECYFMAQSISGNPIDNHSIMGEIEKAFKENIVIQGGEIDSFYEIAFTIEKEHTYEIIAKEEGILIIDMEILRDSIVKIQNLTNESKYSDPCGIILKCMTNEYVMKGQVLCTYRSTANFKSEFEEDLKKAFTISYHPQLTRNFEEIL